MSVVAKNIPAKMSVEEFLQLDDGKSYEPDEGQLIVTPFPAPYHNRVRYRLRRALTDFVEANNLGEVLDETDFRLSIDTVRRPDVAFLSAWQLANFDIDKSPVEGTPALAVEVISPTNSAQDMPGTRPFGWFIRS